VHVTPNSILGNLFDEHPELREVFGWFNLELRGGDLGLTLGEFCRIHEVDEEDLLIELEAAWDDPDEDFTFSTAERQALVFDSDDGPGPKLEGWG